MHKRRVLFWGGTGIFVVSSVLGLIFLVEKSGESSGINSGEPQQITASDHVRGDIAAKLILIEYSDFECPACRTYHPILKRLTEKFGSDIGFVYRHFPLAQIHRNAQLAAMAAESAGRQGKFWEMHGLLFENQEHWSKNSRAKEIFTEYALQLGLNEETFASDLEAKDLREKVLSNYKDGISIGVVGTPTFFMNGKKLSNPRTYEEFEKLISEKLRELSQ